VLAATQLPIAASALSDPSTAPAWTSIPSWDLIGTADHVIPPAEQLFMAHRANAHIVMVNASHLSMLSHPAAVTGLIIAAAQATS
jgi:pimeloyl-ACP methyl ester carboxylesterase